MKLAEALLLRSDMQKKYNTLRERIKNIVTIQEGETPNEDPEAMLAEAFALCSDMRQLVSRINKTNLACRTSDGRSLTEAIAHRDELAQKHSIIQSTLDAASIRRERYSLSEIRWVYNIDTKKLREDIDETSKALRNVNTEIQSANWSIDLEEI